MVVVQFLATEEDTPWHDIGGCILGFEIAIAAVMTNPVDHTCRKQRHRRHLDGNHDHAGNAEHQQHRDNENRDSEIRMTIVELVLEPVIGTATRIFFQRLRIGRVLLVKLGAFQQNLLEAKHDRAVRIFCGLALGMVFTMNGNPFFSHSACC